MRNNNTLKVLNLLVKELKIPVTRQSIDTELEKHPDSSSLLVISDILDRWNVPNAAYHVTIQELLETEISLPVIACFKKGEIVIVSQVNKKYFTLLNERYNNQQLDITEFKKNYQGTILAFQKDPASGETDYSAKRRKEIVNNLRIPFIVFGLVIIFIINLLLNQSHLYAISWNTWLLMLFKTIGVVVSVLLLLQSIDTNNPLIQKFCGSDYNKNCNAILASKAAKLIDELSWSEVGFFYFAGTWLALFFNAGKAPFIQILAIFNLISLPYTFYSIYYQWRVAKQWCFFCCSVQALLWLELIAFLPFLSKGMPLVDLSQWANLLLAMLIPILLWVFIKPYLMNSEQLNLLKPELYKFKYNKELFQSMLQNEDKYVLPAEVDTIIMGNREAEIVITLVSNPFCIHCSKIHKLLDALLEVRDDIKLQLVFIGRMRERETDKSVMRHFMSLELGKNEIKLREAINDWYKQEKKNYELWKEKYPAKEIAIGSQMLSKQKEWCGMVNITSTPTIFVNGHRLPEAYQPYDIQYVI